MLKVVVLDTSPLSIVTERPGKPEADACRAWVLACTQAGIQVYVPEVTDYEVRRELLRAGKLESIRRLDEFSMAVPDRYLPLTTSDMRGAAQMWADVRNANQTTADKQALDVDVILCAQALNLGIDPAGIVIATSNPNHISRFLSAAEWKNIKPRSEEDEAAEKIKNSIRMTAMYDFPETVRFDVELKAKNIFRCVVVDADGTVLSTLVGRVIPRSIGYSLAFSEEPQLELSELSVWEPIYLDWISKVEVAEKAGQQEFVLAEDGELPQLFLPFVPGKTQYQLSQPGMIRVLHSLEDALKMRGYQVVIQTEGFNGLSQLVAMPIEKYSNL